MWTKLAIVSLVTVGFLAGCRPKEEFPNEPVLAIETIERVNANTIRLTYSFTDGDGNVGLEDADTLAPNNCTTCPFYYNLFLDYYEKTEGGEFELVEPAVPFHYRAPFVRPSGQDPKQKGLIEYEINGFFLSDDATQVQFQSWLYDRDFQKSNVITVGPMNVAQ